MHAHSMHPASHALRMHPSLLGAPNDTGRSHQRLWPQPLSVPLDRQTHTAPVSPMSRHRKGAESTLGGMSACAWGSRVLMPCQPHAWNRHARSYYIGPHAGQLDQPTHTRYGHANTIHKPTAQSYTSTKHESRDREGEPRMRPFILERRRLGRVSWAGSRGPGLVGRLPTAHRLSPHTPATVSKSRAQPPF